MQPKTTIEIENKQIAALIKDMVNLLEGKSITDVLASISMVTANAILSNGAGQVGIDAFIGCLQQDYENLGNILKAEKEKNND